MSILLLGANGRTGREFLRMALSAGHAVTALIRTEDRLSGVEHERLRVHVGSACDADVLRPLLRGVHVVVSALGPRWPTKSAAAVYPDSAAAIVHALEGSDARRLLVTSSALLFPDDSLSTRALRRLVPHIVAGAATMENRIRSSNLDWTIARTSWLTNDASTTYRVAAGTLPEGSGAVSRAAVASFLLKEAARADHVRRVVGLCG